MGTAAWRLVSRTSGKTVAAQLQIADGFWSRLIGLQFRRALPRRAATLLVPCRSIHTCFVRFPLDVAFLDSRGAVLAVRRNLRPWRLAFAPRDTHAVLEMRAGSMDVQAGESLRLEPAGSVATSPPKRAAFLRDSAIR